jgi:hypothetical protein
VSGREWRYALKVGDVVAVVTSHWYPAEKGAVTRRTATQVLVSVVNGGEYRFNQHGREVGRGYRGARLDEWTQDIADEREKRLRVDRLRGAKWAEMSLPTLRALCAALDAETELEAKNGTAAATTADASPPSPSLPLPASTTGDDR